MAEATSVAASTADDAPPGRGEWQVLGPPGTGKTRFLSRQVRRAIETRGSGEIMIASFTRAAASEIAGRDLGGLDEERIGTLHSHCYRAIGKPKVADDKIEEFTDWQLQTFQAVRFELTRQLNRSVNDPFTGTVMDAMQEDIEGGSTAGRPTRQMSSAKVDAQTSPDALYSHYQVLRAKMRPRDGWPTAVQAFAELWERWKKETGYVDFTDMISIALTDFDRAPGDPSVGFFDESQDFSPLQLALVRKWGQRMDHFILAGDDDQTIFGFTGATPGTFTRDVDVRKILDQSYRVPAHVLGFAESWVNRLGERRTPKIYRPRREVVGHNNDGSEIYGDAVPGAVILNGGATWLRPDLLFKSIETNLQRGQTTMILAACSYMLEPIRNLLRDNGIPFHNPYRKNRGDWNPLQVARGVGTAERLLSYFKPDPSIWGDQADWWTPRDLKLWTDLIRAKGLLRHGSKKIIEALPGNDPLTEDMLARIFDDGGLERLVDDPDGVLRDQMLDTKRKVATFPLRVLKRFGTPGLREQPKVIIGTIHSVKGGEADHVILFPDISRLAGDSITTGTILDRRDAMDALIRQFYVGITRASETVTVCRDSGADKIELYSCAAKYTLSQATA